MLLHDLLDATEVLDVADDAPVAITEVTHDSRSVHPGALFCCIPGARADGHAHAGAAVARGAAALMVEHAVAVTPHVPQARVRSVRRAIGPVAARFHGEPSRRVPVIGVTGTNGKTTTTFVLGAILGAAGHDPAVLGTLGVRFRAEAVPQPFTTPEAPELQRALADLVARGADVIAMEVSSHALAEHRVDGTHFAATCFTNLSQDHLDLHGSMDAYADAKARLFTVAFTDSAAIHEHDRFGAELARRARAAGVCVLTFALDLASADVRASVRHADARGSLVHVDGAGLDADVHVPLPGRFNVENALAAIATARLLDVDPAVVAAGVAATPAVPGRFEPVRSAAGTATPDPGITVLVDYAHTPTGISAALRAAHELTPGRVLAVFGCGGDRDADKRSAMGAAVGRGADAVVLTTDNPRSEDPDAIAAMAARGLDETGARYTVEPDRRLAIRAALAAARPGDVVMVLGKGAETEQILATGPVPFDDRVVAAQELESACS